MVYVDKGNSFPVANLLRITKVKVASHGNNQSYLISLEESNSNGILRTFEIDFTEFNVSQESVTRTLNSHGYVISSFRFSNHFRDWISEEVQRFINSNQVEYYHKNLGFTTMNDGTKRFLLGNTTYLGKPSIFIDQNFKFKTGTPQEYMSFLKREILPHFETRLAFTIGLASVISSDLMEHGDIGTMVLNFSGQSSTGKTTIIQFMASLWGSPKISNYGIVRTFNATANSLVQTFTGTNGVPIVIDDATSLGVKDLSAFIYNIAAGEDKLRLTENIQLRESKGSWSGLVAISSETSILEHSTKTGGSIPRVLEFDNIVWTQSAKHAKSIKREITKSYGHFGVDFVNRYQKLSPEDKSELFNQCEDEIDAMISQRDQYTNRITSKLAVLYMTAKLIQDFFQFPEFSADEIKNYLVKFEDSKVPVRSIEVQALDIIKTFIIRNQHRLAYKKNPKDLMELTSLGEFLGYKEYFNDNIVEITVISQVLSAELMKHGIYQWPNILRYLEKQPYIKKYGKSNKASETNNYLHVKAITFRFQRENDEMMRWYYNSTGLNSTDKEEAKKFDTVFDDSSEIEQIFED